MARGREKAPPVKHRSRSVTAEEIAERTYQDKRQNEVRTKKRRRRKAAILVLEGLVLIVLLIAVYLVTRWDSIIKADFSRGDVKVNTDLSEYTLISLKGYRTFAVFGTDARDMTKEKGHADVVMLVCINNETGDIKLVSVFRDTFMNDSQDTDAYRKMTTMYWRDGALGGLGALNRNFDLNITEYVAVNWYAVARTIDLLGGIDIEVPDSMMKYINGYIQETRNSTGLFTDPDDFESDYIYAPGYQHLNGVQAVAFCRIRYIDNDYGRAERQRQVVNLMLEKAKTASLPTLISILNEIPQYVSTNIEVSELIPLAEVIARFNIVETLGFPFDKQAKKVKEGGADFVFPVGLEQNVVRLHQLLYENEDYEASETVKAISKYIEKYSGISAPD